MNRLLLTSLIATSAMAATGLHAETYVDHARVRSVQPQYETVQVPRQACTSRWVQEQRRVDAPRQYGGAVIGGVAGAVLGSQVGDGSGRNVATAVGAVLGALTGDRVANRGRHDRYETAPRELQHCQMVLEPQQRFTGYQVIYEYRGQRYAALMQQEPGRTMPIQVSADPWGRRINVSPYYGPQSPNRSYGPYGPHDR